LYADGDFDVTNGLGTLLVFEGGSETATATRGDIRELTPAQAFSFSAAQTRYVHLDIRSNHGDTESISAGEVAFEGTPVPFEFGPIPGIIGIVAASGINYYRRKKQLPASNKMPCMSGNPRAKT